MADLTNLKDYSSLASWLTLQTQSPKGPDHSWVSLLRLSCEACFEPHDALILRRWIKALGHLFQTTPDPLGVFLDCQSLLNEHQADFPEIIGFLATKCFEQGIAAELLPALYGVAVHTRLASVAFLAAWIALNCGDLRTCVDACDLVDEPFAPLATLQGQAYLELGQAPQALESLNIATALDPQDVLPWFQKAKALVCLERPLEAYKALQSCASIDPQNPEIAGFMAIVATDLEGHDQVKKEAWEKLLQHRESLVKSPIVLLHMIQIGRDLGKKHEVRMMLDLIEAPLDLIERDELATLTKTLRLLGDSQWWDVIAPLLDKIRPKTLDQKGIQEA